MMEIREAIEILKGAFSEKVDEASKIIFSFLSTLKDAEMPRQIKEARAHQEMETIYTLKKKIKAELMEEIEKLEMHVYLNAELEIFSQVKEIITKCLI